MAEKSTKTTAKSEKIFDVSKPGKAMTTSETSKPVIVTNRPIMQDPMMTPVQSSEQEKPAVTGSVKAGGSKLVIQPLSDADVMDLVADAASTNESAAEAVTQTVTIEKTEETILEPVSPDAASTPLTPPLDDSSSDTAQASDNQPANDISSENAKEPAADESSSDGKTLTGAPLPQGQNASEEEIKRQAELEELIESKQYFLPINAVESRRSRVVAIVGLLLTLLLAVVIVELLMDTELLIIPGMKPVTDFL